MLELPTELSHPCYHDDEAARAQLEAIRWPNGPVLPALRRFRYREANPDSVQGERRRLVLVYAVPSEIHGARRLYLPS
jgi:hypothetical protein